MFPANALRAFTVALLMTSSAQAGPHSAVPAVSSAPIGRVVLRPTLAATAQGVSGSTALKRTAWRPRSVVVAEAETAPPVRTGVQVVTPATAGAIDQAPRSVVPANSLVVATTLGEIGYANGFRLSNLGGRQEVFIPLPQGDQTKPAELVLVLDDVSAHDARRSLEILVNDRSMASIALDGKSEGRIVRIPLAGVVARDGFLKLSFLYSGAATPERCIDVRYVGDSLTIRPESALDLMVSKATQLNITTTAALMPHNVAILLSNNALSASDIAAALTLSRSLTAAGRKVTFYHGLDQLPQLVKQEDTKRWKRGVIVVGSIANVSGQLDAGGIMPTDTSLVSAHIGGVPVLLVSDAASARDGRLLGNPSLAALRDTHAASVGLVTSPKGPADRISFDQLGLAPAQAEVFGRADMAFAVPTSILPAGTRPTRLALDIMVAPDGNDQKAVVSTFVNERLLASTVAAIGEPTRLDFPIPDGLVGTIANIRVVVQRRSAQGDCRFEPQGYPAEILGSSAFVLSPAGPNAEDFSDLASLWSNGVEVLVPSSAAAQPLPVLGMLSDVLNSLSRESARIDVNFVAAGAAPTPAAAFIAVSDIAPAGAAQHVKFNSGRVIVTDKAGRTRLDLGGLVTGAVAQIVTSNNHTGLWIKALTTDGSLPASTGFSLDRGDVAFVDKTGIALAMSTQRDTLLRISYPEKASWLVFAERFRSWIVGGIWIVVTIVVLLILQGIYRRRRSNSQD